MDATLWLAVGLILRALRPLVYAVALKLLLRTRPSDSLRDAAKALSTAMCPHRRPVHDRGVLVTVPPPYLRAARNGGF